ncbi:DinB family protein [Ornithinimicrobium cavernae]|uniref:DinB family protein n=1 Tax=Ornithinimicrobium cavernae TaxID=2666047 RepID=UPI000D69BF6B|nr:DinB family protein [Ornithinimicrobium cavernae]
MTEDPIEPDTKDWTWTLTRPCPECGFDATQVAPEDVTTAVRSAVAPWAEVLTGERVTERPTPTTWSPVEYACHVRDVLTVFTGRFALAREQDDPAMGNWDQDVAAVEGRYAAELPERVAAQIPERADELLEVLAGYRGTDWDRPVRRSDGVPFTGLTLARYLLHDLEHHLHDVGVRRRGPGDA